MYVMLRIASGWYCKYGRFVIVCDYCRQITVRALYYIYRRQNYKHNSSFIPKTVTNLIEPKVWLLCMSGNLQEAGNPRIHGLPAIVRPSSDSGPSADSPDLRLAPNRLADRDSEGAP